LGRGRQLAVEQQIAGFQEVAVFGQLLDRIATIEQNAFVAVDVSDFGFATARRSEAGIVGETAADVIELGNVDDLGADRALVDGERPALVADIQACCFGFGVRGRVHDPTLELDDRVDPPAWQIAFETAT
jgi:hypothetical protein